MTGFAEKTPPTRPGRDELRVLSETNAFSLGRPTHIRLVPDGTIALYLRSGPKDRNASLYELDLATGVERLLLAPAQLLGGGEETLSTEERAMRERKRISTGGFTSFDLAESGERILLKLSGKVWLVDRRTGRFVETPTPPGVILDPRLSPRADRIAFVCDHDLYTLRIEELASEDPSKPRRMKRPRATALTRGGNETLSHGLAEFVAQEEMNRFVGYWWSPDGSRIAYQETDQSDLERLTIADASRPERAAHTFAYPRAGKKNAEVRLFVVTTDGRSRAEVGWDRARYPYLARVLWQKNAPLSILVQSRDQRREVFLAVDPDSGRTSVLHEETDDAWLNLSASTPRWMPDGKSYLWATERSGTFVLERRFPAGPSPETEHPARPAREVVLDESAHFASLVHIDDERGVLWFLGGPSAVETHLYRAPLDRSAPPERVSPDRGEHEAVFSRDGTTFALTRSTLHELPRATVYKIESDGRASAPRHAIPSVALEPEKRPRIELVPPERAGGLHAMILRPHVHDPKRRYPVVLHVYGGPGYAMVRSSMAGYFLPQWIADHGFAVVSIDGRGTPRRGREFERALKGRFGSLPLEDQVKGLSALGEHYPELDLDRVAVYGWSFGGYMAALAVLRRPDLFKAAVAGAPVADWLYYDTHYTERYLGLPDEDPAAYEAASLLTYAAKLERPLLLVHGIADDNVYFAHTLQLADALFRAQRPFEMVPLVGLTHQVADPSVREALYARIVSFLGRALW